MDVLISNEQKVVELDLNFIREVSLEIMGFEKDPQNAQLSLLFCDDEAIKSLNREYRGKDEATDVLSFPMELENFVPEIRMLGDIVISTETAIRQANEYKHPLDTEIVILLIHGLLHLHGYDHIKEDDCKIMRLKETELLKHLCEFSDFARLRDVASEPLIERVSESL